MHFQQRLYTRVSDMAKHYPLDIESCGEEIYILRSKGHHDPEEFKRAALAEGYTWKMGEPKHVWCKTTPAPKDSHMICLYAIVPEGTRGAYPATYCWEA